MNIANMHDAWRAQGAYSVLTLVPSIATCTERKKWDGCVGSRLARGASVFHRSSEAVYGVMECVIVKKIRKVV